MTAPYTAGTIDLVAGSEAVTGDGTGWEVSLITGGTIYVEFDGGNPLPIATVDSDTEITAALKWTGPTGTYSYAIVRDTAYGQQTVTNAQALATYIQRLNNPALAATAGVTPGSNKLLLFTGANSATVIDLEDILQGVKFDEEVPTLADRAPYDGEAEGFRVLVADVGDGRAAFFSKKSATAGDWSVPFYITGPFGGAGPYTDITIGPTETLPAGSEAEVTLVPVSPGIIRLDFGLPKGADGTGTGDVVSVATGVAAGTFAQFTDATAKEIGRATIGSPALLGRASAGAGDVERLTQAQANQVLGGWESIAFLSANASSALVVNNLAPFYMLRISHRIVTSIATASMRVHVSSDNGSSFITGSGNYTYNLMNNLQTLSTGSNSVGGGNGVIDGFSLGDGWVGGNMEIQGFNAAAEITTSISSQRIRLDATDSLFSRFITQQMTGPAALNSIRISAASGNFTGKIQIEGIRG